MAFIPELNQVLRKEASPANAVAMEKYLKHNFKFLGIKTALRRSALQGIWKKHQKEISCNPREIAWMLYQKDEREFHLCGVEILIKTLKGKYDRSDKFLIEKMITTNSWWDTVDFLAKYLMGNYLLQFPEEKESMVNKFSSSSNTWLNRSAILFQLNYKQDTDYKLLFRECIRHSTSKEFFIQKAIGWALREFGKANPLLVMDFVERAELKPLSKREAVKKLRITKC